MKLRNTLIAMVVLATVMLWGQNAANAPPVQPLPYSHKQHIALGLKCEFCHIEPGVGEMMTFPATEKCMSCHQSIDKDKPAIQKLAAYAKSNEPIPWVRVYKIPEWVDFSHKVHLQAGAKCQNCHGQVAERDVLFKEVDLSMGTCMECHRENNASVQCDYCHDPR
jgi:Cytochrome c7 and related cytochrome c/Class III cytochrome C family